MGNSTITLASVYDAIAAKGVPDPRGNASGYGDVLALELANQVMADLICDRFNWKWNSAVAAPVYTNSWQQDYPQPAQTAGPIGWGERCDMVDINSTVLPKRIWNPTWRRQLARTSLSLWQPTQVCWMYNGDLSLGTWPGANVTFYPLVTTGVTHQNPIMSMLDAHGNILIVTGFGATGVTAPAAAANAAEGTTVTDGSVTWTVVSANSQGFRVDKLPSASGPTYQILPTYQLDPPMFTTLGQMINPIPNSYSRYFYRGLECECLIASVNPGDMKRGQTAKVDWLNALNESKKQGDRELNSFGLLPASHVVERRWDQWGPYTADQPY